MYMTLKKLNSQTSAALLAIPALLVLQACSSGADDSSDSDSASDDLLAQCESAAEDSTAWADFTVTPPTQKYVMAVHGCVTGASDCTNPQNHEVFLTQSDDATTWSLVRGWDSFVGSVPDVVRRSGKLYIVSNGLATLDLSTGTTSHSNFVVLNESGANSRARDVAFGPKLADGTLTVVYVPSMQDAESLTDKPVYYAEEVAGSDGTCFQYKTTLATTSGQSFIDITDPDLFYDGTQYVLYTSFGANVHSYTSATLDGEYTYARQISSGSGGVPTAILLENGSVMTFVNREISGPNTAYGVFAGAHAVNTAPSPSSLVQVLSGTTLGTQSAESPGIALNSD